MTLTEQYFQKALLDAFVTTLNMRATHDWEEAVECALEMVCEDLPLDQEEAQKMCDEIERSLRKHLGVLTKVYGLLEEIASLE